MKYCPDCGSFITYHVDEDNSNYNEYICEYYNDYPPFRKEKCWWRESSGRPAIDGGSKVSR